MTSRRHFISKTSQAAAGLYLGSLGFSAKSYGRILGANDRVRVGVVGFSDRHKSSHMPCFLNHYKELNFDIVAVSGTNGGKKAWLPGKKSWDTTL